MSNTIISDLPPPPLKRMPLNKRPIRKQIDPEKEPGEFLMSLVWRSDLKHVQNFVEETGIDVNYQNSQKDTPLIFAAETGKLEIVKYLLKQRAEIDTRGRNDFTALAKAVAKGHLEVAEYLIERGADTSVKVYFGRQALSNLANAKAQTISGPIWQGLDLDSFRH